MIASTNPPKSRINRTLKIKGHRMFILWRVELGEAWFIECGQNPDPTAHNRGYISLVRRVNSDEVEILLCNNNLRDQWRILDVDTKHWGAKLLVDVEPNDEAVITEMRRYAAAQSGH